MEERHHLGQRRAWGNDQAYWFLPHHSTEETSQHLFLSRNAFLVPLPPGRVMQVAKCLVPSCYPRGAEKLRRTKDASIRRRSCNLGPDH